MHRLKAAGAAPALFIQIFGVIPCLIREKHNCGRGFFSAFVCLFCKGLPLFVLFKNFMFHYIESLENEMYSLAVASQ